MAQFQPSSFSGQFKSLELAEVQLTGKTLGKGSDATVQEVNWLGTLCAAKQLHENLLEDDSPSGARCLIENFEKECMTWSHLVHPCIVQFLGVHFLSDLHVPMLILEKMDTSLRNYLEAHNKEDFLLPDKVYVLRQVAQALSYLHSLSPPLVHHDLSPNNVLLNGISLQAKVTDFGMTRALDPSKMTRKSSVKGTQAFMAPEALVEPPKYDEKLDVFSYGNVIVTTVTHQWPNPGPYNRVKGGKLVAVSELQRRQQYIDQFSQEEGALLLPTVRSCLENRPNQRPTSIQLVNQMKQIESSHPQEPHSGKSAMIMVQLHTLLHRKESELQECRTQLREKDTELQQKDLYLKQKDDLLDQRDQLLRQQHGELEQNEIQKDTQLQQYLQEKDTKYQTQLQEKDDQLKQKDDQLKQKEKDSGLQYALLLQEKDDQLKQKDEDSGLQYALLLQENQQIQQERDHLKHERDQLKHERDQLRYELDQYRREWNQISTHQPKPLSPGPAPPLSTPTELPSASKQVSEIY